MNKKKFPKKIYLLNNENLECLSDGTDWCEDSIYNDDVLYIKVDELIKTISKINKELYHDEFGLYDWNEVLLRELGVDER